MLRLLLLYVAVSLVIYTSKAGYRPESFDKLILLLDLKFPSWDSSGINILEFGDQLFYGDYPDCYAPFSRFNLSVDIARNHLPAKVYFQQIPGVIHTSVDINGNNGAIALDVRKPMIDILSERYDVITNYGFTEHVGEGESESDLILNQYLAFKNMHDVASIGTLFVHYVPPLNQWRAHGVCGYENEFFTGLIAANGYGHVLAPLLHATNTLTAFVKQSDTPFISIEAFAQIPGLMSKYPHYGMKKIIVMRPSGQQLEQIVNFAIVDKWMFAAEVCAVEFPSLQAKQCVEASVEAFCYAGVYNLTISNSEDPAASSVTVAPIHS